MHVYFYFITKDGQYHYYGYGLIISTLFNKLHTNDEKKLSNLVPVAIIYHKLDKFLESKFHQDAIPESSSATVGDLVVLNVTH